METTGQGFTKRMNGGAAQAKKAPQTTGQLIMQIAEMLRPRIAEYLKNARDENGMPVQPARIRGISLIIAQELVKVK